jgi:hypothetical protein
VLELDVLSLIATIARAQNRFETSQSDTFAAPEFHLASGIFSSTCGIGVHLNHKQEFITCCGPYHTGVCEPDFVPAVHLLFSWRLFQSITAADDWGMRMACRDRRGKISLEEDALFIGISLAQFAEQQLRWCPDAPNTDQTTS